MSRPRFLLGFWGLMTIAPIFVTGIVGCHSTNQSSASSDSVTTPHPTLPPLIEATLAGDVEIVRSLLQSGTDPNLVYHTNTALTYAARDGFTEIARALIEAGADVNWIDGEGVTPLILAAFKGHLEIAELLLAHEADTTVRDQWDRTALDYALRRGEEDAIAQLLQMPR
ncbi:MAG: ankyrin repeat domain-containing protein [Leptolyngbya sp. SIO1D8]|nr:ankyrin repeat domain-containing protein [Leptolyngbya sp. SIO1D8]